jgi:hypothetical protein
MNRLCQLSIRLLLDGWAGEIRRWRSHIIGFPFSLVSMAKPAILLIKPLALLKIVVFA